ncbi:MAG TPA: BTAD domain-containing putative transcriptional regulator, partial [Geminicoccaceae bacterium]|nr:BTAD domain-containing putative transcriptional regulator [Geminicoccaceae bacterium]
FGGAQVSWGDGRQLVRLSRPSQVLLGFLVVHRHRTHQREVLASILWDEVDDARARHRINTALWRLRRALAAPDTGGDECIVSEPGGGVGFNPRACEWLDVALFEDTIAKVTRTTPGAADEAEVAALQRAVDLYAGDLLPGCYDEWVMPERRRLETLFVGALEWLMRDQERRGLPESGIGAGLRLLRHDPLREDVHRYVMRLYASAGQRQLAIRQYDYCRDLLASELDISPMPETEALHRQILQANGAATAAHDLSGEQGRLMALLQSVTDQLDQVRRRLDEARLLIAGSRKAEEPDAAPPRPAAVDGARRPP